jgi:hypothetical protein
MIVETDKYERCPLASAGFSLHTFTELPALVIGPDGRCICTADRPCLDPDRRDGKRCTLEQLRQLDLHAAARRGWQYGYEE